ncbi:MAG: hypothetical protein EOM44_14585 [Bacteroidia bacterium]|nr:hypothetical protein [Bacteroidia bacterium]
MEDIFERERKSIYGEIVGSFYKLINHSNRKGKNKRKYKDCFQKQAYYSIQLKKKYQNGDNQLQIKLRIQAQMKCTNK